MRQRKGRSEPDIASRKSSKQRKLDGEFLEGTESSFDTVDTMPNQGFKDAWDERGDPSRDASLDAAIDVGQKDTLGDLDRSPLRRILIGLLVVAGLVAGGFYLNQFLNAEPEPTAARAVSDPDPNILASPIDERAYEPADAPVVVEVVSVLDDWFVDENSAGAPLPRDRNALGIDSDELSAAVQATTTAGTVFWGGRLHVALVSDRVILASPDECLVVAMAASDLSSLDVAGVGGCDEDFVATGDRIACAGANAVLIEVWPRNPDAVTEQAPVDSVRVRIEYAVGGDLVSQRGTIDTTEQARDIVSAASVLSGEPGEVVQIDIAGQSATCELIDRVDVEVRLLPG